MRVVNLFSARKGQVFTPDFAASVALFSLFLLMFGVVWNTSIDMFVKENKVDERQHSYTFSLLRTNGAPNNWTTNTVEVVGLYDEGELSAEKFLDFYDIGVQRQRKLLRAEDFYMGVYNLNGSIITYNDQKLEAYSGPDSSGNITVPRNAEVFATRSMAILEETGQRVELRYYTWT